VWSGIAPCCAPGGDAGWEHSVQQAAEIRD
jgi:hypothetical protein